MQQISRVGGWQALACLNRVFGYKSSILGYHYFWKHPHPNSSNSHPGFFEFQLPPEVISPSIEPEPSHTVPVKSFLATGAWCPKTMGKTVLLGGWASLWVSSSNNNHGLISLIVLKSPFRIGLREPFQMVFKCRLNGKRKWIQPCWVGFLCGEHGACLLSQK